MKRSPECNAFLADLRLISGFEQSKVTLESTLLDNLIIPCFVVWGTEQDVILRMPKVSA